MFFVWSTAKRTLYELFCSRMTTSVSWIVMRPPSGSSWTRPWRWGSSLRGLDSDIVSATRCIIGVGSRRSGRGPSGWRCGCANSDPSTGAALSWRGVTRTRTTTCWGSKMSSMSIWGRFGGRVWVWSCRGSIRLATPLRRRCGWWCRRSRWDVFSWGGWGRSMRFHVRRHSCSRPFGSWWRSRLRGWIGGWSSKSHFATDTPIVSYDCSRYMDSTSTPVGKCRCMSVKSVKIFKKRMTPWKERVGPATQILQWWYKMIIVRFVEMMNWFLCVLHNYKNAKYIDFMLVEHQSS